jgi:hypothetical protein
MRYKGMMFRMVANGLIVQMYADAPPKHKSVKSRIIENPLRTPDSFSPCPLAYLMTSPIDIWFKIVKVAKEKRTAAISYVCAFGNTVLENVITRLDAIVTMKYEAMLKDWITHGYLCQIHSTM